MTAQEKKEPRELWIGWEDGENPEVVFDVDESDPRGAKKFIEYEAYRQARLGEEHNAKAIEILTQERDAAIAELDSLKEDAQGLVAEVKALKDDAELYLSRAAGNAYSLGRRDTYIWVLEKCEEALKAWNERNGK